MSLRDVTLGQIILHVTSGTVYVVKGAQTASWTVRRLGPVIGRGDGLGQPETLELTRLSEFRVVGRQGR